ncbi:MAG: sel1 repeat family protein [Lachnospiraceae bacterium]|nr:sel1 repeat family protein [Lachnospiraceae bacterium]
MHNFYITESDQVRNPMLNETQKEASQKALDVFLSGKEEDSALLWEEAARMGDPGAMFICAKMCEDGKFCPQDYEKALYWYEKSADLGNASAQFNLGNNYFRGKNGVSRDYEKVAFWFEKSAEQGEKLAQYSLGLCYAKGYGVPQDWKAASKWYEKAARQEHGRSQYRLACNYALGRGVPQSYNKALEWAKKANGHRVEGAEELIQRIRQVYSEETQAEEMYIRGFLHDANQVKTPYRDDETAAACYAKAAELGHAEAQFYLGAFYQVGRGVPRDREKAIYWFRKAAEQGMGEAQFNMGTYYGEGKDIPRDSEKAVYWFQKSAENGIVHAQYNLGLYYYRGDGVEKNPTLARYWLEQAAGQGDKVARRALEKLFENTGNKE